MERRLRLTPAGGTARRELMRILFLTSAHNSLSQRLWIELGERGHENRVCVAETGEAMIAAVSHEAPDLILAPMLKIAIPREVWSRHLCLIVHPGIKGQSAVPHNQQAKEQPK